MHQLVVLFVAAAAAAPQYSNPGQYYYPEEPYQPPLVQDQSFSQYQPVSADGHWQTLRDNRHQSPSGEYAYEFETQNGIIANEQSYIAGPNQAQRKTGFYQYPSPDGRTIRVDYVADENGFQVEYMNYLFKHSLPYCFFGIGIDCVVIIFFHLMP